MLTPDTLLGDRYQLAHRIAVGGMGEVWRAEDTVLDRTVAVKVLKSELTVDPTFRQRFHSEARTTASLSHPGIANVFDYGEARLADAAADDVPVAYLVMEHVDGEPLSAVLARDGRLPVARVLDVVRQAALALDEAHRAGMVHRDVKPGNLLIRRDYVVKITDFGIARAADAVPLTQSGMVVGTAQYFSPEQAEGRVVGPASDVYSLGVVAYECLAGRLPFVADSSVAVAVMQIRDVPPPLPADVPAPVRSLVLRALAKDPRQRFGTGGELAEAVRAVQGGWYDPPAPPLAHPPPWAHVAPPSWPAPNAASAASDPARFAPPAGGVPAPARATYQTTAGDQGSAMPAGRPVGPGGRQGARPGPHGPAGSTAAARERGGRPSPRWPLWVAGALLLALATAAAVTVLMSGSGRAHGTGGPARSAGTITHTHTTGVRPDAGSAPKALPETTEVR